MRRERDGEWGGCIPSLADWSGEESWAPPAGSGAEHFGIFEVQIISGRENSTCYFTEWCAKPRKQHVHYERVRIVEICYENFWPTPKNFRQHKNFRLLQKQLGVLQHPRHPQQYAFQLWLRLWEHPWSENPGYAYAMSSGVVAVSRCERHTGSAVRSAVLHIIIIIIYFAQQYKTAEYKYQLTASRTVKALVERQ